MLDDVVIARPPACLMSSNQLGPGARYCPYCGSRQPGPHASHAQPPPVVRSAPSSLPTVSIQATKVPSGPALLPAIVTFNAPPPAQTKLAIPSRHRRWTPAAIVVFVLLAVAVALATIAVFPPGSRNGAPAVSAASPEPVPPARPSPAPGPPADCLPAEKAFGVCPAPVSDTCSPMSRALRVC